MIDIKEQEKIHRRMYAPIERQVALTIFSVGFFALLAWRFPIISLAVGAGLIVISLIIAINTFR